MLAYSAVKGKSISSSFQSLLAGQSPANAFSANTITPPITDSTGFNVTTSNSSGGASQQAFFSAVLTQLGAPVTQGALNGFAGITNTEGVNSYNNPFNIEWHPGDNPAWQGIGNFNSVGVQEYATFDQGVAATAAFLQDNSRWSNVVAAAKAGNQSMLESALGTVYRSWGSTFKPAGSNASSLLSAPVSG